MTIARMGKAHCCFRICELFGPYNGTATMRRVALHEIGDDMKAILRNETEISDAAIGVPTRDM